MSSSQEVTKLYPETGSCDIITWVAVHSPRILAYTYLWTKALNYIENALWGRKSQNYIIKHDIMSGNRKSLKWRKLNRKTLSIRMDHYCCSKSAKLDLTQLVGSSFWVMFSLRPPSICKVSETETPASHTGPDSKAP